MILRLPAFVVLWLIRLAVFVPLAIIGIPIVWFLARRHMCWPSKSARFDRFTLQFAPLFWVWSNEEDGVDGLRGGDPAQQWWAEKTAGLSPEARIFRWAALRNPVDNLRWVPLLNPKIDPNRVRFVGMDHEPSKGEGGWFLCWQGVYASIRYETRHYRFWLGWKLKPEDRFGLDPADPRSRRCDFAIQLKRIA